MALILLQARVTMNKEELIKNKACTIIDVRTPIEFMGGSVVGALNIPLNEIPLRIDELKQMKMPLVLCCASGARSGQAEAFLRQHQVRCLNAGSWLEINHLTAQNLES